MKYVYCKGNVRNIKKKGMIKISDNAITDEEYEEWLNERFKKAVDESDE